MAGLSACKLLLHIALGGRYGYHGDELYFVQCGRHLAFGYVDHPPLVPWIARLAGELFGDSLVGLRFFPAVAGALAVALTISITRRWDGGPLAQLLAGLAVLIAPAYLRIGNLLCIPAFELFFWTLGAWLLVVLVQSERPKLWLAIGGVAGLGLLNKHTMLFWGLGLLVGIAATSLRAHLLKPWLWAGGGLALLIFLPNLIWQSRNDWATLEFIRNISDGMLAVIPRHLLLLGQLLYQHPLVIPLWVAGLVFLFSPAGRPYRALGWLYLTVLGVLLITKGKPYYLAPAYPPLLAGGAVLWERFFLRQRLRWAGAIAVAVLIAGGALTAGLSLPILDLEISDRIIARWFGFVIDDPVMLTGDFHDQYGWEEQTATLAAVYATLSAEEREKCTILTQKYNQAAAVDFFGHRYGLPGAVSGHMSYHLWGPGPRSGEVVIAYGIVPTQLEHLFGEVTEMARTSHPLAPVDNNDLPVYVCRKPRKSLREAWPELKNYDHWNPPKEAFQRLTTP